MFRRYTFCNSGFCNSLIPVLGVALLVLLNLGLRFLWGTGSESLLFNPMGLLLAPCSATVALSLGPFGAYSIHNLLTAQTTKVRRHYTYCKREIGTQQVLNTAHIMGLCAPYYSPTESMCTPPQQDSQTPNLLPRMHFAFLAMPSSIRGDSTPIPHFRVQGWSRGIEPTTVLTCMVTE